MRSVEDLRSHAEHGNEKGAGERGGGGVGEEVTTSGAAGRPVLSFVIPAHNEERYIGATLASVFASAREVGEPFEVIVVDDASTDRTAEIAGEHGAKVVPVAHRQISATRN